MSKIEPPKTATQNSSSKPYPCIVLNQMWESLTQGEQDDALNAFWTCDEHDTKKTRKILLKSLAEALHYREVLIKRSPVAKKVGFLREVISRKPFIYYYHEFIRAWLVQKRRPLLKAFRDECLIPDDDGFATNDDPPTVDQFEAGIAGITGKFPQRDITLYIIYLACFGSTSGYWNNLVDSPSFGTIFEALKESNSTGDPKVSDQIDEKTEPESDTKGFTTLDDHLIRTLVASAFHEVGALNEDAVEDLVEEVVALNASRHRTLFHRGFFHALFDRPFCFHFPAENSERRQWYLSGAIFGLLRHNRAERCVEIFAVSNKDVGDEIINSANTPCGPKLLPYLCLPLLRAGHQKPALRFVRNQIPRLVNTKDRVGVIRGLFDYASKLLREGNAAEAEPLFDLLLELISDTGCELPEDFRASEGPWIKRRKAQCLQSKGSFLVAKAMLSELCLEKAEESPYKALTDLALIGGGFRSLAAVLPKPIKNQNKALIDGIRRGLPDLEKAIEVGGNSAANAHFCMGIHSTLESPTQFAQERADHFQIALGCMLEESEAYSANGILDWTRFLLALALLETAEPSNFLPASELIPPVIETELRFPAFLWERMFEAASLFDDTSLAILVGNYLSSCREETTECLLANPAVLARSQPLFEAVLERFLSRKTPVRKCWSNLQKLLPEALSNQALEVAGTILDRMEVMAINNNEFRHGFIEILRDSDRYSPAWETEDAQESLVNLLEIEGSKADAVEILRERFFQVRGNGAPHRDYFMGQIIERIMALHGDSAQFADLIQMMGVGSENLDPPAGEKLRSKVLYIGGDERQESYRAKLIRELRVEHPELCVDYCFPGWSSNWNVHLAKLKPMICNVDVVVINSLIRTQLGRHLRKSCNAEHPWLPCTGRGFDSLKRSIIRAAVWVKSI